MHSGKILILAVIVLVGYLYWRFLVSSPFRKVIALRRLRKSGLSTKGIVIDHVEQLADNQPTRYASVVKFNTVTGEGCTIQSDEFRTVKQTVGDRLEVTYYRDHPTSAVINTQSAMWSGFFLVCVHVLVFAGISLFVIIKYLL